MKAIERAWTGRGALSTLLLPLSWLYAAGAAITRWRFGDGRGAAPITGAHGRAVPTLVIGNLSAGGTGKTPLTAALAARLQSRGLRPGIVSRGHGGERQRRPRTLVDGDVPADVGDEPLMLARATGVPVCVCVRRDLAVAALAARGDIDVVLADDGLQHYRMARQIEICVVDAQARFGNRRLLPAGPLRERPARLDTVDLVVWRTAPEALGEPDRAGGPVHFAVVPDAACRLGTGECVDLEAYRGRTVHAVAGLGQPRRFFEALRARGIEPIEHAFPDHHAYRAEEIAFGDELPTLTTSKDAVKLATLLPLPSDIIEVRARALFSPALDAALDELCARLARTARIELRSP